MNVFPSLIMKWCKKTRSARGSCVMGVKAENSSEISRGDSTGNIVCRFEHKSLLLTLT